MSNCYVTSAYGRNLVVYVGERMPFVGGWHRRDDVLLEEGRILIGSVHITERGKYVSTVTVRHGDCAVIGIDFEWLVGQWKDHEEGGLARRVAKLVKGAQCRFNRTVGVPLVSTDPDGYRVFDSGSIYGVHALTSRSVGLGFVPVAKPRHHVSRPVFEELIRNRCVEVL